MSHKLSKSEAAAEAGIAALQRGKATVAETAAIFGVVPMTINYRLNTGQLPGIKIGRKWWIPLKAIVDAGGVLPPTHLVPGAKADALLDVDLSSGSHTVGDNHDDD